MLEEARTGKGATDRMNKQLLPKIFNGSLYGLRLPIGQESVLKSFAPSALQRFYHDWYRPDLMAVIVVGDVEPAKVEAMIRQQFSSLKNPPNARARVYASIPARTESEALVITDKEADNNTLFIRYPVQPLREPLTFRDYRRKLIEDLMVAMLGQRLQELTQQANPPFVGGNSGPGELAHGYKSYNSLALLGRDGPAPAIRALVEENERARQFGFGADELDRSKKNLLRAYERVYNEREKTESASYAQEYVRNFLEHEVIPGVAAEYRFVREALPGINADEVNAFARENIPAKSPKLVVYLGSDQGKQAPPKGADLLAAVEAAEQTAVNAGALAKVATSLMPKPPTAGSIVSERENKLLGTHELLLSNGLKVILKPTNFKNDQVLLQASRYGGQSLFDAPDMYNAQYGVNLVESMGLDGFAPSELQKILAGKSANVGVGMGMYSEGVGGESGSDDIETMLQLVYLRFGPARRDEPLYQSFVARQQDVAKHAMAQPESVFRDATLRTLYGDHPRVALTPRPDDFSRVNLERALAIYGQRFGSAKGFTFVLVGSFEVQAIKPLVARYLASLPTGEVPTAYRDLGIAPVTGVVKQTVHSGSEAKSTVTLHFNGPAAYTEQAQIRLHALAEVINLRINDVLREKLTLIYSGDMSAGLSDVPRPRYAATITLPCGPDHVNQVIAAMLAQIDALKQRGPEPGELDKVKRNWLQAQQKSLHENHYWLQRLDRAMLQQHDPAALLDVERQVQALTGEDIKAAARQYLDLHNYVQLVLDPVK